MSSREAKFIGRAPTNAIDPSIQSKINQNGSMRRLNSKKINLKNSKNIFKLINYNLQRSSRFSNSFIHFVYVCARNNNFHIK